MRVLYDHQAFKWSRYGGIPRYFFNLISEYHQSGCVDAILPCRYCMNEYYKILYPNASKKITWVSRDKIIGIVSKYTRNNLPAGLLSYGTYKSTLEYLSKGEFDLFHPTFFNPYFIRHLGKHPFVLTIHDLSVELYPELNGLSSKIIVDINSMKETVSRIISLSQSTKNQFIEYYDINPEIIDVVHLASGITQPIADGIDTTMLLHKSKKEYILFCCQGRYGNKNVHAYLSIVKKIIIEYDLEIVFAGGCVLSKEEIEFFRNIGLLGRIYQYSVNEDELIQLYKRALVFVFPSLIEGFGIPILEAFTCGCPVICSNSTSLPEIGEDAALYFGPKNISEIKETLMRVITDEKLREMMRERGYKQAKKFSWKKCAEETKAVYEKAIE